MKKKNTKLKFIIIAVAIIVIFLIFTLLTILKLLEYSEDSSNETATLVNSNTSNNEVSNSDETEEAQEIEEIQVYANDYNLRALINNDWNRIGASLLDDYEEDENGNYLYDGCVLYSDNGTFIRNVVFNSDYEDTVVGNLTVGATEDEIIKKLGEPQFENSELGIIGYKAEIGYIFFSEGEISVYPNLSYDNEEFEELLFEYVLNSSGYDRTTFVVLIREYFNDFTVALDDNNNVVITSAARGIKVILNGNYDETEIILYDDYEMGESMESNFENIENDDYELMIYRNITVETSCLTEIVETERILSK